MLRASAKLPSALRDSILRAAGLEQELASTDIFRANQTQNIVVISTELLERAVRHTRIEQIKIGETTYATRAYVTPPEYSVRGVIHNISPYDPPEDIASPGTFRRRFRQRWRLLPRSSGSAGRALPPLARTAWDINTSQQACTLGTPPLPKWNAQTGCTYRSVTRSVLVAFEVAIIVF
ncbi:hypothetical protein HPB48_026898 [Haemaphysalis longicornis]|uniref:Uncharacterized protein n=1 Tax=Haemaphysalis longicornis TaxID=44386 RepID=A0A9J6HBX1_HAELO|nr:hypothetical protein HPB48_026898 [Haemaphysalis longicornis]